MIPFLLAAAAAWFATASPIADMDHQFLTVHMLDHLILMTVAAPLLLMSIRRPLPSLPPAVGWLAGTSVVIVWHIPTVFAVAMQSDLWHIVQQGSFLAAGVLFWWPVFRARTMGSPWASALYLFLATLPCDALSAFLVFCDRVVYTSYLEHHPAALAAALEDQARAGALMWVWVTFAYLAPAVLSVARGSQLARAASRG